MSGDPVRTTIDELLDQARRAAAAGEWAVVEDLSRRVLAAEPENDAARHFLAMARAMPRETTRPADRIDEALDSIDENLDRLDRIGETATRARRAVASARRLGSIAMSTASAATLPLAAVWRWVAVAGFAASGVAAVAWGWSLDLAEYADLVRDRPFSREAVVTAVVGGAIFFAVIGAGRLYSRAAWPRLGVRGRANSVLGVVLVACAFFIALSLASIEVTRPDSGQSWWRALGDWSEWISFWLVLVISVAATGVALVVRTVAPERLAND